MKYFDPDTLCFLVGILGGDMVCIARSQNVSFEGGGGIHPIKLNNNPKHYGYLVELQLVVAAPGRETGRRTQDTGRPKRKTHSMMETVVLKFNKTTPFYK